MELRDLFASFTRAARGILHDNGVLQLQGEALMQHCLQDLKKKMDETASLSAENYSADIRVDVSCDAFIQGVFLLPNDDYETGTEEVLFEVSIGAPLRKNGATIQGNSQTPDRVLIFVTSQSSPYTEDITTMQSRQPAAAAITHDIYLYTTEERYLNLIQTGDDPLEHAAANVRLPK